MCGTIGVEGRLSGIWDFISEDDFIVGTVTAVTADYGANAGGTLSVLFNNDTSLELSSDYTRLNGDVESLSAGVGFRVPLN